MVLLLGTQRGCMGLRRGVGAPGREAVGGACCGWRTLRDGMADLGTPTILPGIKTELLEDTAAFSSMGAEHTS